MGSVSDFIRCDDIRDIDGFFTDYSADPGAFRNVSGLIPQYYSMQASAERLMEIEDMEEESQKIRIEDVSEFQKDFFAR